MCMWGFARSERLQPGAEWFAGDTDERTVVGPGEERDPMQPSANGIVGSREDALPDLQTHLGDE